MDAPIADLHFFDPETGADMVPEPFQDAAGRAVDLLCGAREEERTEIPAIDSDDKQAS